MAVFQKVLDDKIVGASATTAPTGFTSVVDFPTLVQNARTANLPLFLRPGIYPSLAIDVLTSNGGGNPLYLTAGSQTATIQLNGTVGHLLKVDSVPNVILENIVFDGNGLTPTDNAGLLFFNNAGAANFEVRNCTIKNTKVAGIYSYLASGTIKNSTITSCDSAVTGSDSVLRIENNTISSCSNNGIFIQTSTVTGNGSWINRNKINSIDNVLGGTGPYGNGILVFRAGNVKIAENHINTTKYSGIRLNGAGNCHVANNYIVNARETALYLEAPGAGINLTGGVVSGNIIDGGTTGISVANSGQFGDGTARKVTVIGNQISNITFTFIPEENANGPAAGIIAEGSCNIVGNSIENCAGLGMNVGTGAIGYDLLVSGNFVHTCPLGIGYGRGGTGTVIVGNTISVYKTAAGPSDSNYPYSGAIVSTGFDGVHFTREVISGAANTDYGNATQTSVGNLTVGMNRAHI